MTGTVWYCYAVARPFPPEALGGLRGVRDAEVRVVAHDDLVAVVSPVPADEFDESSLHAKFEDLAWLEAVARQHDAVVERIAQHSATLPFRLATIYFTKRAVDAILKDRARELGEALDRISGQAEWGVKVFTREPVSSTDPPADDAGSAASGTDARPGLSYLRRRRSERDAKESAWEDAAQQGAEIDRVLTEHSEFRRQHRAQGAELSGAVGQNVLNVAYLVPVNATDQFIARAQELQDEAPNCRIELTGPWAPYSFAFDGASFAAEEPDGTEQT
jgi:hypothetical protein